MPYGMPWGLVAYRCVKCGKEHSYAVYRPYCAFCGTKQPDESEVKSLGLMVFDQSANTPRYTQDFTEMNEFLRKHRGKPMALWNYGVSHSELELRLNHSGGPNREDEVWLNTMIYCSATETIQLPELRWLSDLKIVVKQNVFKTPTGPFALDYYFLVDEPAKVQIKCRSVVMYFDIKPGL